MRQHVAGQSATTITVGSMPEGVAISSDGKTVYVANSGDHTVSVIDTSTNKVTTTTTTIPAANAQLQGVAVNGSNVYVTDAGTTHDVFVSTDGAQTFSFVSGFANNTFGVAVSPNGRQIYVTNPTNNTVTVLSNQGAFLGQTTVGKDPTAVAVAPAGTTVAGNVYVTNQGDNTVSVSLDGGHTFATTINVGKAPDAVAVSPNGNHVYVANSGDNTVITIPVGGDPQGVAVSPDGTHLYVTNSTDGTVSVITLTNGV